MQSTDFIPQLVIVMGGAGSGKNYYISHDPQLSSYVLVDVDEIKQTTTVSNAISQVIPSLSVAFQQKENVAHPTTGVNLKALKNKITLAHSFGYYVTVVLIDTHPDIAQKQVQQRVDQGGHSVEPSKIDSSNERARKNYEIVKDIADKALVVHH